MTSSCATLIGLIPGDEHLETVQPPRSFRVSLLHPPFTEVLLSERLREPPGRAFRSLKFPGKWAHESVQSNHYYSA
eukprot:scaffold5987_cov203-Amphora_coffeaeformis.AAC.9